METAIVALIAREEKLKLKLKKIRTVLKKQLTESEIYKQVYEAQMNSEEFKVSKKTATAHALKVARANYAEQEGGEEEEEGDESA